MNALHKAQQLLSLFTTPTLSPKTDVQEETRNDSRPSQASTGGGFGSFISGFGGSKDKLYSQEILSGRPLSRWECETLYQFDGVAASVVDVPADDATRKWVQVVSDSEVLGEIQRTLDTIKVVDGTQGRTSSARYAVNRALKLSRQLGGSAIILGARDGRLPHEPLNEDGLEKIEKLYVHHRHELIPHTHEEDGSVRTYMFCKDVSRSTDQGSVEVHASRLWTFNGVHLSGHRQLLNDDWGDPVFNRLFRALRNSVYVEDQTARTVGEKNIPILKIPKLQSMIEAGKGDQVKEMVSIMGAMKSIIHILFLDSGMSLENHDSNITGLEGLLKAYPQFVSAAARIPVTKLYGISPGGLNSTGESDITFYYDMVTASIVELHVLPFVRWLCRLLMISKAGPTQGRLPSSWDVLANPLREVTEKEKAEIREINLRGDKILVEMGAVESKDVAQVRSGKDGWRAPLVCSVEAEAS